VIRAAALLALCAATATAAAQPAPAGASAPAPAVAPAPAGASAPVPAAEPAPAPPGNDFEACKARRRALMADAMAIADPDARARALTAMPVCRRFDDGRTEVVAAAPPPAPDTTPFHAGLELAAVTGIAATTVMSDVELAPSGGGPFVEVEVGDRWNRAMSLAAYVNYTRFSDNDVAVSNGPFVPASIITVTDNVVGFGLRGSRHVGPFAFGLGVGAAVERMTGYQGMTSTNVLRSIDAHVAYQLAVAGRFSAQLMLIVGDAGHPSNTDRELVSARLAVGLHF